MADRVEQNADLEDVLSSIRRLVSQNSNPQEVAALVLTEAERVSDEDVLQPAPQPAAPHPTSYGTAPTPPRAEPIPPQPQPVFDDVAFETEEAAKVDEALSQVDATPSELDLGGMPDPASFAAPPMGAGGSAGAGTSSAQSAAPIDMDNLREIVTDIVREELRGPLGQKITRNVRKLVRQEIQRAMNVKALD